MADPAQNRRILLCRRPSGLLVDGDLGQVAEALAPLAEGEALVRTRLLAMDPVSRVMLTTDIGIMPPVALGAAVRGFGAGEVVASSRGDLPVGSKVGGFFEWADYQRVLASDITRAGFRKIPDHVSLEAALNLHGHTAFAAYFGMIDVGRVQRGDTVVVTGAAGAVGSVAGQIAKIKGARVIGTASSAAKCRWLLTELGFDAAVDYKSEDVDAYLGRECAGGIDVLFDNVGGPLLNRLVNHLARGARAILCGASAQYLGDNPLAATYDAAVVEARGAVVARFSAMNYAERFETAVAEMVAWQHRGQLRFPQQLVEGLARAPEALNSLFNGHSRGRLLVRVEDGWDES